LRRTTTTETSPSYLRPSAAPASPCQVNPAALLAFVKPCVVSDPLGPEGRALLAHLDVADPWREHIMTAMDLIATIQVETDATESELRGADHLYVQLVTTVPGVGCILGCTISPEIRESPRLDSPQMPVGYSGLAPRVIQFRGKDCCVSLSGTVRGTRDVPPLRPPPTPPGIPITGTPRFHCPAPRTSAGQKGRVSRWRINTSQAIWCMGQTDAAFAPERSREDSGRLTATLV